MAKQDRAVRTRTALIESAAALFDSEGYELASLSTISERAGVSSGALHFHFTSKAALAEAVGQAAVQRLEGITRPQVDDALQALIDVTHALVRALDDDVVLRAGFGLSDSIERVRVAAGLRDKWQGWVEDSLGQADREGALASEGAAQDAATALVAVTAGLETLGRQDEWWLSHAPLTRFWQLILPRLAEPSRLDVLVASGSKGGAPGL
ncbi:ScbR family autoregulator-binding transcription factor [Streptomyces sp. BE230]|uniref:ScbR family autoregulator-binding transcription factor n=1 Tax=Streptomyces sp. BE230 TaxID=3002526 RepID=UPI002ED12904|nr:ScbR family autoregulator-binding transcription factor [Streptomyces sp. BE230]